MLFPGLIVAACATLLGIGAAGADGIAWWAMVPLLGAAVPAVVLVWWLRGRGALDPAAWLHAAFLAAGAQLLLGAIPSYGISVSSTPAAIGIFVLCWVFAAASCLQAHRARRALLEPMVPELGSTQLRLAIAVRFALTAHDLVSAHIDLDAEEVSWSARRPRARGAGMTVHLGRITQVSVVGLPPVPALQPWLMMPGGPVLYAQPGPAVVLTTTSSEWMLPVHDAVLLAELVNRRRELWAQRNR
ncbi:hypothetical protein [Lentzea sp. NPDC051838]|uniref:hypothetical protein n=1 Tax=Lentzea sp. NPDC051838 TaxID=3154849 RepID=UPI0034371164